MLVSSFDIQLEKSLNFHEEHCIIRLKKRDIVRRQNGINHQSQMFEQLSFLISIPL